MGGWISDLIGGLFTAVLNGLTSATRAALTWALGLLSDSVFTSPDVTAVPQVSSAAGRAQLVANALMVLVVMVVGALAIVTGGVSERYSLKELLPRMLIGFLAANMAVPVVRAVIASANAVTRAFTGDPLTSRDSFEQIRRVITGTASDPATFLVALVLRELALWMLVLLIVTWLGRIAVLLVVAATAPVALMCHALPQTDPVARVWWRTLLGVLAVQVLQAVTLQMAVTTLLSADANLPALGLPHDPTGLLNLLITCFVLWLVIRIPRWVARTFGGGGGRAGSVLGYVVRVVIVQQALRAVGLRGRRLLRQGPAAGGYRSPAPQQHLHQHTGGHQHEHLHTGTHQHLHQHVHVHPPGSPRPRPAGAQPGAWAGGRAGAWAGGRPTARAHPGRPPRALEARPALPPATRRAIGPR